MTHPDFAPAATVVIPLYDDAATIGAVLDALSAQQGAPPFDVLVVDDGSRDDGPAITAARGVRVIAQANGGPAAARNAGARAARGAVVLFLDSDCVPPPHWVATMLAPLADRRFDGVMGAIRAANDGVVPRIVQMEVDARYVGMRSAGSDGVDFIAAPACAFRREAFLGVGGFDERLRQAEDVEMAYRFTGSGHRIAFVDTAPVAHAHQTGWIEFLRVKHARAIGRMRVFELFPAKRRHDSWTPLSLKIQFALSALAPALVVGGLVLWPPLAVAGAGAAAGVLVAGRSELAEAVRRVAPLTGSAAAAAIGAGFLFARAWTIWLAVLRVELGRRLRPAAAGGRRAT